MGGAGFVSAAGSEPAQSPIKRMVQKVVPLESRRGRNRIILLIMDARPIKTLQLDEAMRKEFKSLIAIDSVASQVPHAKSAEVAKEVGRFLKKSKAPNRSLNVGQTTALAARPVAVLATLA